jgi:hypothetical protein
MKLSELVAFRSSLEQYDFYQASRLFVKNVEEAKADIDRVTDKPNNQQIRFSQGVYQDELPFDLNNVETAIADLQDNFEYYKQQIDLQIQKLEEDYIKQSEKMYMRDELPSGPDVVLERSLQLDDQSKEVFYSRVSQLSDWRFPGMIIRPQETDLVEEMASSDPLYLVDYHNKLIEPCLKNMNNVYRHRVRPWVIDRYLPRKTQFNDFPKEQFGLIVIWNTLNNMPLTMCSQILNQLFDLLRPGGTCLLTFNDCNNAYNIRNFENNYRQFTPGDRLENIVKDLGYAIKYRSEGIHGWMEIQKPGKLETIRGGQSLARVIHSEGMAHSKKTYTKEQIKQIHQEAIALGIDTEEKINGGAISLGKLELLINRRKHAIIDERKLTQLADTIDWKASNRGFAKGQHVRHGNKLWCALVNIAPKQRFDEAEWRLVE